MPDRSRDTEKAKAWSEMKAAVRAYAHDPSGVNGGEVESACGRLRRAETDSLLARGRATELPRGSTRPGNGRGAQD